MENIIEVVKPIYEALANENKLADAYDAISAALEDAGYSVDFDASMRAIDSNNNVLIVCYDGNSVIRVCNDALDDWYLQTGLTVTKPDDHLYNKYPTQTQPQGTYLDLDPSEETLRADWNSEIGNAIPVDVWHGRIRRYTLPSAYLRSDAIGALMDEVAPLAQRVCDGYSEEWDGSNYAARLTDDAQQAEEGIYEALSEADEDDCIQVWDADEWYRDERSELVAAIAAGATDEELEEMLIDGAGEIDVLENVDSFIRQLRDEYADAGEEA